MGRLELYAYDSDYGFLECSEVKCERGYGLGGGASYFFKIWNGLEEQYLPPFSISSFTGKRISRMAIGNEKEMQKIVNLINDDKLEEFEKILLLSTFDYGFIKYESIDKFCNALKEFENKYGDSEAFETVIKALEHEKEREIKNRSKFFGLYDSVSGVDHLEIYAEEESEDEILELLNENEDFKADKDGDRIFLDLEKFYEEHTDYFI